MVIDANAKLISGYGPIRGLEVIINEKTEDSLSILILIGCIIAHLDKSALLTHASRLIEFCSSVSFYCFSLFQMRMLKLEKKWY